MIKARILGPYKDTVRVKGTDTDKYICLGCTGNQFEIAGILNDLDGTDVGPLAREAAKEVLGHEGNHGIVLHDKSLFYERNAVDDPDAYDHRLIWDEDVPVIFQYEQFSASLFYQNRPNMKHNIETFHNRCNIEVKMGSRDGSACPSVMEPFTWDRMSKLTDRSDHPVFPGEIEEWVMGMRKHLGGFDSMLTLRPLWHGLYLTEYALEEEAMLFFAWMNSQWPSSGIQSVLGPFIGLFGVVGEELGRNMQKTADKAWGPYQEIGHESRDK